MKQHRNPVVINILCNNSPWFFSFFRSCHIVVFTSYVYDDVTRTKEGKEPWTVVTKDVDYYWVSVLLDGTYVAGFNEGHTTPSLLCVYLYNIEM